MHTQTSSSLGWFVLTNGSMVLLLSSNTILPVVTKHHISHLSTHRRIRTSCTPCTKHTQIHWHMDAHVRRLCVSMNVHKRVYVSCELAYIMYTGTCVVLLREVPQKIEHSAPLVVQEQSVFRFLRALDDFLHVLETIACEHIQQKENTHHARRGEILLWYNCTTTKSKLNCDQNRTLFKWITLYTCMHAYIFVLWHHVSTHAGASSDNCAWQLFVLEVHTFAAFLRSSNCFSFFSFFAVIAIYVAAAVCRSRFFCNT